MSLTLNTAPASEPVTLSELKDHLRVVGGDEDTYLTSLIVACRELCEIHTRRRFVTQTWDYFIEDWPEGATLEIPFPKLQSISFIKYKDSTGTLVTWDSVNYEIDSANTPGYISLEALLSSWPTLSPNDIQRIQIRFVCGYGNAAAVPEPIKMAIKMMAAHFYANREDVAPSDLKEIPMCSKYLLLPFWVPDFS